MPRLTHLQIEAIPDDTFAQSGPGRGASGEFVLSEIELSVKPAHGDVEAKQIKFSTAIADSEQEDHLAEHAIDGKTDTGWSLGEGARRFPQHALFTLAEPLSLSSDAEVTVRLVQQAGGHRTFGHFLVSLGNELPDSRSLAERRTANRDRHFAKWIQSEAKLVVPWQRLRPVSATSKVPSLDVEDDDLCLRPVTSPKATLTRSAFKTCRRA